MHEKPNCSSTIEVCNIKIYYLRSFKIFVIGPELFYNHMNGLAQDCSNSSAPVMELLESYAESSISVVMHYIHTHVHHIYAHVHFSIGLMQNIVVIQCNPLFFRLQSNNHL